MMPKGLKPSAASFASTFGGDPMLNKFISWLMSHTIEAWDDKRDPEWNR